jgi:hypothetical protein
VKASWWVKGFGGFLGGALGDITYSYITTRKVNWCTAAIWGGVGAIFALL